MTIGPMLLASRGFLRRPGEPGRRPSLQEACPRNVVQYAVATPEKKTLHKIFVLILQLFVLQTPHDLSTPNP